MDIRFYNEIESNPIIAAVKDMDGLHKAVKIDSIRIIFILFGDVCNIAQIVDEIKENNKVAMVHIDLIVGLSAKDISVDFIKNNFEFIKHSYEESILWLWKTFLNRKTT